LVRGGFGSRTPALDYWLQHLLLVEEAARYQPEAISLRAPTMRASMVDVGGVRRRPARAVSGRLGGLASCTIRRPGRQATRHRGDVSAHQPLRRRTRLGAVGTRYRLLAGLRGIRRRRRLGEKATRDSVWRIRGPIDRGAAKGGLTRRESVAPPRSCPGARRSGGVLRARDQKTGAMRATARTPGARRFGRHEQPRLGAAKSPWAAGVAMSIRYCAAPEA
jgi:hypothetical protein